jgi:hypothetical protein
MLMRSFKTDSKALVLLKNGIGTTSKDQKHAYFLTKKMNNNDKIKLIYCGYFALLTISKRIINTQYGLITALPFFRSLEAL